jgi:hypothetical protein
MKKRLLFLFVSISFFGYAQNWGEQMQTQIPLSSFGYTVAIDGEYAVVGAPTENLGTGSATIYKIDANGTWNEVQKITAYVGILENDFFGAAVAIQGDLIFVSATNDRINEAQNQSPSGSVLIYQKNANDNWVGIQRIRSTDIEREDHFGSSIAVDGNYLLIGAEYEEDENSGPYGDKKLGAAYVFKRDGQGLWSQTQKLITSQRNNQDKVGKVVALSGDYIVLGSESEAVYIFKKDGNETWTEVQVLTKAGGSFGTAGIAIDGDEIVISDLEVTSDTNVAGSGNGAIYIFKKDANNDWNETQKLITTVVNQTELLGSSLALDGNILIASAPGISTGVPASGGAYLFVRNGNNVWVEAEKIVVTNPQTNDEVGGGTSINSGSLRTHLTVGISGNYFILGAPRKNNGNGTVTGAAYLSGDVNALGLLGSNGELTQIPDDNFENYLETHDENGNIVALGDANSMGNGIANDNAVLTASIKNVQTLTIQGLAIANLTGLEDFNALQTLNCSTNNLTTLDVTLNTALLSLQCQNNNLTALNVKNGNNENFTSFSAINNANLLCIQVDDVIYSNTNWSNGINNQTAFSLNCEATPGNGLTFVPDANFESYLETHDKNRNIVTLGDANSMGNGIANDDYVFTASIEAVTFLDIKNLNIQVTTGLEDFTALQMFNCQNNLLSVIDVTQNQSLHTIDATDNNLVTFNVSQNPLLVNLSLRRNQLTSINVTQNPLLRDLNIDSNQVSILDVSQNPELRYLNCDVNSISVLDVSNNPELLSLNCQNNQLQALNVNNNPLLEYFNCRSNLLSSLQVSLNLNLISLNFSSNNITGSFDLSQHSALTTLSCYSNDLTELNVKNGNNNNFISFSATNNENLLCVQVDDVAYSNTNWSNGINNQTVFSLDCTSSLATDEYDIKQIAIYPNPTSSLFVIKFPNGASKYDIEIFDIQGKMVFSKKQLTTESTINITHLESGVYFLKINADTSSYLKKIIKI